VGITGADETSTELDRVAAVAHTSSAGDQATSGLVVCRRPQRRLSIAPGNPTSTVVLIMLRHTL
jgi:hypothetical protein